MARAETLTTHEQSVLIFGGSGINSIGRATVDYFYQQNARDIWIGSTSWENYSKVLRDYEKKGLPTARFHPFVVDITDKKAVAAAANQVRNEGHQISYVVFSQAGGMDSFIPKLLNDYLIPIRAIALGKSIYEVGEKQKKAVEEIMAPMYEQIRVWREENIPRGMEVNYFGTINALGILASTFPDGFTGVFINSTWGYLSGTEGVEIPLLYGPVDIPKAMVRDKLRQDGRILYEHGYPIAELIASLVRKTRVGRMFFDYLLPITDPEQAQAIKETSVNPEDVAEGTGIIIGRNPDEWEKYPLELFVTGKDRQAVFTDHLEMSAMYSKPYPY